MKTLFTLEVLDDAPEAVAMGSNKHPLPLLDLWDDLFVPEGQSPGDGVLEALAGRQLVLRQVRVTPVLQRTTNGHSTAGAERTGSVGRLPHLADGLIEVVLLVHRWGRDVE